MELTKPQKEIVKDSHRFRVVNCGRRFGKTTFAIEEIIGMALSKEAKIAYIAPTYQQARDIAWDQLKKRAEPIITNVNESRLELKVTTQHGGESTVVLRGWESIESLRGQHFDFLVIDEVASMRKFWIGWQEVLRPTLTDTRGQCLFISTPKGFNHFYDLFLFQAKDDNYRSFHFTSYDNPHIPRDEIDAAKRELPKNKFEQEYMANFRKAEGLVYKEFDRSRHVYRDTYVRTHRTEARMLGVDFGYTNPTAVLTIERDAMGHYFITEEWYRTGKTNIEIVEYAKSKEPDMVYPDPAEPDRIQEMSQHGLYCREVNKDIVWGIDKVRELFKQNRIHIHESCVNLIAELESYSYPESKDGDPKEKPIKEMDHATDALRYCLAMQSDTPNAPAVKQRYKPTIPNWKGHNRV